MKKSYYFFALFITTTLFMACQTSKGVKEADEMGKHAFTILQKFDTISKDAYLNSIFTVEEIKLFGEKNADIISEKGKKEIENLTAEDYNKNIERDFNNIRREGEASAIVWSAIEYADYTFEEREQDNITGTKGTLTFTHNDVTYSVNVSALISEDRYRLIRLSRLRQN